MGENHFNKSVMLQSQTDCVLPAFNNYHCRQKQSTTTKGNTLWVLPFVVDKFVKTKKLPLFVEDSAFVSGEGKSDFLRNHQN